MASRTDFYFRQKVTEAELDLAFELLEKADRDLAADIGVYGIVSGAEPTPHAPVPDLTIDLTAPGRAYDNLGQRIFFGTGQTVDCSVDHAGLPTEVPVVGQERWIGVFLRFERLLSDPRTDGNSQQVFFRRDESFEIVIRQGATAASGHAVKVPLQPDELLICDLRRAHGQTQILAPDIDTSRRQAFIFAQGDAVQITSGGWSTLAPATDTVQSTLDAVDAELTGHFGGSARRHPANDIDYAPHGFVGSHTVQTALNELIDELSTAASGHPGAMRVGADAATGTPHALPAGNVDGQLSLLLSWLNAHVSAASGAHNASAIAAQAHHYIGSTSVQAQLQEIVSDLQSPAPGLGASRIGNDAISSALYALVAGTVRQQLAQLVAHLVTHVGSADHDMRYFEKSVADARYYNVGELVADADTVDGQHASAFALAGHDHDRRYLRLVYSNQVLMDPNSSQTVTTQAERPELVTISYAYPDASTGFPQATTYARGNLTSDLRYWITKVDQGGGDKDYRVGVQNLSSSQIWVFIAIHRSDP